MPLFSILPLLSCPSLACVSAGYRCSLFSRHSPPFARRPLCRSLLPLKDAYGTRSSGNTTLPPRFSLVLSPVLLLPAPRHTCSSRGRIRFLVGERRSLSAPSLSSSNHPLVPGLPCLCLQPLTAATLCLPPGGWVSYSPGDRGPNSIDPWHATPRHYQQRERTRGRKVEREKERNSPRLHSTTPLEDSRAPERLRLRSHVLRAPKLGRNVVESSQEGKESGKKIRGVPSFVGHSQSSE